MEGERVDSAAEQELRPQFDAILVHSFWISRKEYPQVPKDLKDPDGPDAFKGSLRSRLVTRAAALFYNEGLTDKIVVVGGKVKGPSYPSNASVIRTELLEIYKIPEKDIFFQERGDNTEGEVEVLSDLAMKNSWSNVASVSFETHRNSVLDALSNIPDKTKTSFVSVEDIINKYDKPAVKDLLKRLDNSGYELGYKAYETTKAFLRSIPPLKKRLYEMNKQIRKKEDDSLINDLVLHSLDKFKS